ncbi:MAG: CapA family protein [bacterium]|nr:CapA family protein [bacterium]
MKIFFVFLCILSVVAGVGLAYSREFLYAQSRALLASVEAVHASNRLVLARFAHERAEPLSLLFVGDIMLARGVGMRVTKHNDPRYPFLFAAEQLSAADLVFGNLEGPISARGKNQGSIYSFRAEPRVALGLTFAGFDVLSLANNHIWDWGAEALVDTVLTLEKNGIVPVGAGESEREANTPRILTAKDTRIAFLAYTTLMPRALEAEGVRPGLSALGKAALMVAEAKRGADLVIVSMHWGEEYEQRSNAAQQKLARELIEAGADLIVGHHPHVPQELERYQEGWIAYSLGNFVFDQYFSEETMGGAMLKVIVKENVIDSIELLPFRILATFQPDLVQ